MSATRYLLMGGAFILIFLIPSLGIAEPSFKNIEIKENTPEIYLSPLSYIIEVPDKNATIEEVIKKTFNPSDGRLHIPIGSKAAYFVGFTLNNQTDKREHFILRIDNATIDLLDFYLPTENGTFKCIKTGDQRPFINRGRKSRVFEFELFIPKGEQRTYFLKIDAQGDELNVPIELWFPSEYADYWLHYDYTLGVFTGLMLLIIIFYSFWYYKMSDFATLLYIGTVLSGGCMIFFYDGYGAEFTPDSLLWFNNVAPVGLPYLGITFLLGFTITYFKITKERKVLLSFIRTFQLINFVLFLFTSTNLNLNIYILAIDLIKFVIPSSLILILSTPFLCWKREPILAKYYALSFFLLTIGVVSGILRNANVLHFPFDQHSVKLGISAMMVTLALAMIVRFKLIDEATQALALEHLRNLNKLKEDQNADLEHKVIIRTQELNERNEEILQQNEELTSQAMMLQLQKEQIEEKSKQLSESHTKIKDSINYAKRIQDSFLPSKAVFSSILPDHLTFFKPRDVVSGDFFWVGEIDQFKIVACADCTGHGVPGGFMSVMGSTLLQEIIMLQRITEPGKILDILHSRIQKNLRQDLDSSSRDGMDISIVCLNTENRELYFSGAKRPLLFFSEDGTMHTLKGDLFPVGGNYEKYLKEPFSFTSTNIKLDEECTFYMFSDGFSDQFGGPNGKKYASRRFKEFLSTIHSLPFSIQEDRLTQELEGWMGTHSQLDDILVIGFRI